MTYRDRPTFDPLHTTAYFRSLLFGPTPSVADYYAANSNRTFSLIPADHPRSPTTQGVVGPFRQDMLFDCALGAGPGCAGNDADMRRAAISSAAASGFDFGLYDANRNGVVDSIELLIVMIHAGAGRGAVRGPDCVTVLSVTRGWINVCARMAMISEDEGIGLYAHEISHLLGTVDLYGCWDCLPRTDEGVTNMSVDQPALQLDPYHKIQLGWVTPRIYDLAQGDGCATLAPRSASPSGSLLLRKRPVILYDSRSGEGAREYFIVESRTPRDLDHGDPYDHNLTGGEGVAIWQVRTDSNGKLVPWPYLIMPQASNQIDSQAQGDDAISGRNESNSPSQIFYGANSILETRPIPGRERTIQALFNLLVPANHDALGSPRVAAHRFWGSLSDVFTLEWIRGPNDASAWRQTVPAYFRVSSPALTDATSVVRWSTTSRFLSHSDFPSSDLEALDCWSRTDPPSVPADRFEPNDGEKSATQLNLNPTDIRTGLSLHSAQPGSIRTQNVDYFRLNLSRSTGLSIRVRHEPLKPINLQLSGIVASLINSLFSSQVSTLPAPMVTRYEHEDV